MIVREKTKEKITKPNEIADIVKSVLQAENEIDRNKEHFWVIGMNAQNQLQYMELVSLGILNNAIVHPREVYRMAIFKGVNQIIVAHNHPSGTTKPSKEDKGITKRLKDAGEIIGIELLDHVIVASEGFYSFTDEGSL
ncbi:MAG: JAB domain-containing protein [Candidatus Daviesbacteria bacterium]|nr:JAB domain-containing protein [Candidatus Daviesbacteria bacterium]